MLREICHTSLLLVPVMRVSLVVFECLGKSVVLHPACSHEPTKCTAARKKLVRSEIFCHRATGNQTIVFAASNEPLVNCERCFYLRGFCIMKEMDSPPMSSLPVSQTVPEPSNKTKAPVPAEDRHSDANKAKKMKMLRPPNRKPPRAPASLELGF